ncbi:carbohydrate ABC transporter permease [Neglectibacter sp. CSJ-5]|uniref:carbohydrate ABC transporter permease n=1 Tax=Neglectibacter sp. CSJ-5 TaxID=3078043 RepID=UPI002931A85D|nr:carbohydrate ABC transporter permease [Neglectibacter sp. CSJ-5]
MAVFKKNTRPIKQSAGDRVFDIVNAIIMTLITIVIVYPLYYVLLASITDPTVVNTGKLLLYPEAPYIDGYKRAFSYAPLWTGYKNTLIYTFVGTIISLICTIPAGYALSRMDLPGRRVIMFLFTFTMFFNGGIVPLYLVVQNLHIYDTIWAVALPVAVSVYNLIVCRSFFDTGIPIEMLEAAKIDGCNDFVFFFRIVIPLSSTIIAVMCLFYATALWNQFFNPLMFLSGQDKMPLQVVLRNLVLSNQVNSITSNAQEIAMRQRLAEQLKYCTVVLAAAPLLIVYPFLQKYFAKGVMVGAVKG